MKDIKARNQKGRYLEDINEKLGVAEWATTHPGLVTGTYITFVQVFLKAELATMVLAGATRLIGDNLDLSLFLVYLIAASRFYDPVSAAFTNMAAMFSTEIKINRIREMEEQLVQTGRNNCKPSRYDVGFEYMRFAYHERGGMFKNVTLDVK